MSQFLKDLGEAIVLIKQRKLRELHAQLTAEQAAHFNIIFGDIDKLRGATLHNAIVLFERAISQNTKTD